MPIPPGPYEVRLANVGNPDFRQDPSRRLPGTPKVCWAPAESLAAARRIVRQYIADNDLGGGNWAGGEVRQAGEPGVPFARFSYNGRLWENKPWQQGPAELPVT